MGNLGPEQLAWLADDLKGKSASTPIVVFAHVPLWTIAADWGWGTQDSAEALQLLARFGSVTVLNGHIHQLMQKVEGNVYREGYKSRLAAGTRRTQKAFVFQLHPISR
jgi:3',5'-cyclic-AMP phosphodiesterase